MEELDNLYNVITREGLFTQSLDKFKNKLNSEPDYKRKVYDVVVANGLYTKNYDNFNNKYYKGLSPATKVEVKEEIEVPEVEEAPKVEVEEKVETPNLLSSITEALKPLGNKLMDEISKKALKFKEDYEKLDISKDKETIDLEYEEDIKTSGIDKNVVKLIEKRLQPIVETSKKQRESLGEYRTLNKADLVDLVQIDEDKGITKDVLQKYKKILNKSEQKVQGNTFTTNFRGFPEEIKDEGVEFGGVNILPETYFETFQKRFLGKSNPKINGIGVHDHMFATYAESDQVSESQQQTFDIGSALSTEKGRKIKELKKYLQEQYPDYSFKTHHRALKEPTSTFGSQGVPFRENRGKVEGKYITFNYPVGLSIVDPRTGDEQLLTGRNQNVSYYDDPGTNPSDLKFNLVDFMDTHGFDLSKYVSNYMFKQPKYIEEINQASALTPTQNTEIADIALNPDLFDIKQEVDILREAMSSEYDFDVKYKDVQPYEEELNKAKGILENQAIQKNKNLQPGQQKVEVTEEDIQNLARQIIINDKTWTYQSDNFTNYLEEHEQEKQAIYKLYKHISSDRLNLKAAANEILLKNMVDEKKNVYDPKLDLIRDILTGNYQDPIEEGSPEEIYTINYTEGNAENGIMISAEVSESTYNLFNEAMDYKQDFELRYQAGEKEFYKTTDELQNLDFQLELLGKNYDTSAKFMANVGTGFATIGAGIAYGFGKAIEGATYFMEDYDGPRTKSAAVSDFLLEQGKDFQDWKNKTMDQYARNVSFDNAFSSPEAFGRFFVQEAGTQIPIFTTLIASGGTLGPAIIGSYTMGDKWMQMDVEDLQSGETRSNWQKFGVSLGYGSSEAILGALPTSLILKRGSTYINRAGERALFDFKKGIKTGLKLTGKRAVEGGRYVAGSTLGEMMTETPTTMIQNMLDGRPILENVDHTLLSSGMLGFLMSSSPVLGGMALKAMQDPKMYADYDNKIKQAIQIEKLLENSIMSKSTKDVLQAKKKKLLEEAAENLRTIENLTQNELQGNAFDLYNAATTEQYKLQQQAKEIFESNDLKGVDKRTKNEIIKGLNEQFNQHQYFRDLFRNHKSFGNAFGLLKDGTEEQQLRYKEIMQQAEENVRTKKGESPSYMPSNKDVMDEAYDIYVQENIENRIQQAENSNGVKSKVARTNKEAIQAVKKAKTSNGKEVTEDQKQEIIDDIESGELNGLEDLDGDAYVFMENAISNERTSTIMHEPGHQVFKKILGEGQADFTPMVAELTSWLQKTDPKLLTTIQLKQTQDADSKIQAEEFVMEFLEQIDQGNIDFNKTDNKNLAALFGYTSGQVMKDNGGFNLDLKGQKDAVNFLVNLAAKIRTGTLTKADIESAKESGVIKALEVDEKTTESTIPDSEIPIEKETFTIERDGRTNIVEVITNKDGSRTFTEKDSDGDVASSQRVGKDNTLTNKEFVEGSYADVVGESTVVKGTENINPKKAAKIKAKEKGKPTIKKSIDLSKVENQNKLNELVGPTNEEGFYTVSKKDFKNSQAETVAKKLVDAGSFDRLIGAQIKVTDKKLKQEIFEDSKEELKKHIERFNPIVSRNLFGYINTYLGLKVGTVATKTLKQPKTVSTSKKVGGEDSKVTVGETLISDEISPEDYADMKLAQDKLKKIKPQQSKLAKKLDLTENEINLAKRDVISFLRKADRPAMTDPKKFFKAFVDYTTGKGDQPGGFAKIIYDKLSLPKDGRLSTKNREAFIREIAEDLIALNKVDPAVMRRSKWKPFYELEIKNMSPKQTQKAIDEGRIPSTTNLKAGNDLFRTLDPSVDQVVDYLMGIRPDVLKRKMPKFLGEVIVKNEFNEILQNPKQPVYDPKGKKTDNTIDLSESITEEEVVRGGPQVKEKIARPKGIKLSKERGSDYVTLLQELSQARDIKQVAKLLNLNNVTVNDSNRKATQEKLLEAIKKYNLSRNVFESAMPASSGAIRVSVGKTKNGKLVPLASQLESYLKENKIEAKKGEYYYLLDNGKWAKAEKVGKSFKPPKDATNLLAARGRLYYGKNDPAYITALKATKEDVNQPKRVYIKKGTQINKQWLNSSTTKGGLTRLQQMDINMDILEDVTNQLSNAVKKGMDKNLAALLILQGYQATNGLIKISAPLNRVSETFEYSEIGKQSKGDVAYREEHNPPASVIGATLIEAIVNNNVKEVFPSIRENYYQTQLSFKDDFKLDLAKLDAVLPQGSSILDNSAIRLAAAGINLNTIINLKTGKSIAEDLGLPLDTKLKYNPDAVFYQNEIIKNVILEELDIKSAKATLKEYLKLVPSITKVKNQVNIPLVNESRVIKASRSMNAQDVLNKAASLDEALRNARNPKAPIKKIRVFDFDDTLARTKSNVLYTMPDGTTGKLTAEEFAQKGDAMLAEGAVWDFSEFNKVMDGKKGPLFNVAKKIQEARGTDDVFVLTARAPEASPAIKEFLDAIGLNIPLKNISGLGDSSPFAKSNWIVDKAAEGYNDFYFADDHTANVKAVSDALQVLDVKSKVQQAKIKFSKDMSKDFNTILEESKGVDRFKIFSDVKAQLRGARKGRGKFFIPPSAEDFQGLLYSTLGKGKQGERHLQFYDKALFKPYAQAMENLAADRVNLMADFKALKKDLDVPKDLRKQTESGFTNEQAVRVYLWNKTGQDIPGISKTDLKELTDIIENDPKLKAFAEQILSITKGDGYSKPGKNWAGGTITTDLIEILNTTKRSKYLETWQENVDIIFSKENMNKLEAIFGPKYVEALKHSLARMKAGKNRIEGGNRLSNRVLDYINNSTGAIMFFNMRSALLQTISAANFINWSFNNPLKAGKAFANQPQYWKDFITLMNSEYLVDRRNGLKLNINESEIADAAKTSKNKAKAVISYIIEKGYIPTKFADSFAIATGGATFYRNRINDLIKNEGLSKAEAEKIAMQEFRRTSEISQQSSDPSKISQQQSTDLGRVILQFVNTPMQYARIQKRAAQDIINRRGDNKTNVSKIIYYAFLQNMIFNALQSGLFALGFGDDEELSEGDEKKIFKSANGMLDSWLRGLGFAGVTVQVLKNLGIDIYDRSKRDRPEYGDAWMTLLEFSPAIKSKLSKIKGAAYPFDSKKRRAEVFDKGFSLDNPAYESLAKVITATTNIPIDRLFTKTNNIKAALDEDTEAWKSVAMILGWPEWQLETNKDRKKALKDDPSTFESWEQKSILRQFGLSDRVIKKYKNKDLRTKKILQLQKEKNKQYLPQEKDKPDFYTPRGEKKQTKKKRKFR